MKAILKHDEIIALNDRGTEIGNPPSGIGLERLRFNGKVIVDLNDLTSIWVQEVSPRVYKLHSVNIDGGQLVNMTYADRKNLVTENGVIRVKTPQESTEERLAIHDDIVDNKNLKGELQGLLTDLTYAKIDQHIDNVFGALTGAQKISLKRLYKVVLFLAKRNK
jgi:hypothetical protein